MSTICILGGGIGGVVVARELKRKLGQDARIIVIDKSPDHLFAPSLLWVAAGIRTPEQIKRPLSALKRKGIEFIQAEVTSIEPEKNLVTYKGGEVKYDHLVLSLGAATSLTGIPGLAGSAIDLYSMDGAVKLRDELRSFSGGNAVVVIPAMPYKCPAAPHEAALLVDSVLRKRGVRDNAQISIVTVEPQPMPTAGPAIGAAIKELLTQKQIEFRPLTVLVKVDRETKVMTFTDGSNLRADLLIAIPLHNAPEVVKSSGLTNEGGWVPVDARTMRTKYENVYAIGDLTAIKLEGKYVPDKPLMLPKAGVFAHGEAIVVANNIAALIKGTKHTREFSGLGSCFLELGDGTAGYSKGNFYALPHPKLALKGPARRYHLYKALFEKYWFWRWL